MTVTSRSMTSQERPVRAIGGFPMLVVNLVLISATPLAIAATTYPRPGGLMGLALVVSALGVLSMRGLFSLQPNEARVLVLFGHYHGTVRDSGFHWANPFYSQTRLGGKPIPGGVTIRPARVSKLSLRANNFNSPTLKVNDKRGNPVEIAAVIVWRVEDTAQAAFDVEDYESYVQVQSEAAIRSIASAYAYDHGEEQEVTLRGGGDEVALELKKELGHRLAKAGVAVDDARLTHLAYAPEIASAMLRRQQAEAVIAARSKIVVGAVSMVEMALRELEKSDVVKLDEERKAAMVSNLLVVLCGTEEASPVINTGTLYN
jgi:regulator of protease activity HflC (stomatin/prohibitin superfamily)